MKQIQTVQYAELSTLTPELGVFVITGALDDVQTTRNDFRVKVVSQSTFERYAYGRASKKLAPWF